MGSASSVTSVVPHGIAHCLALGERSLLEHGDLGASRSWFDAGYVAAEAAGRAGGMAQAALGLGGLWVHEHRTAAAAAAVEFRQRQALARLDPATPLALRLRARLAAEADYRAGSSKKILSVVDDARAAGDPTALAEALGLAHHCVLGPDDGPLREALVTELLQVASRSGRRIDRLMGVLWRTVDRFLAADPHAERSLGELRQLLAERDNDAVSFVAAAIDVMLHVRAATLDDAERLAGACAGHGKRIGDADADAWHGAQLLSIRWYQGRDAELLPLLVDLAHSTTLGAADGAFDAAVAAVAAHAGDRRRAAGALARVVGSDLSHLPRRSTWLVCLNGVVEAAHLLEDATVAAHAYRLLEPYAGLPMTASLAVTCFGSVHHALGLASLTVGDVSRAVRHLEAAVRSNTALGHWPAVVASRTKLAEALRLRADRGDAELSASLLAEARQDAADLNLALPPSPSPSHRGPSAPARIRCRRRGRLWQISLGSRAALVEDVRGMSYLATLLAHPGREVPALELASPAAARPQASVQPVLDLAARDAYRDRITRLRQELLAVDSANRSRTAAIEHEIGWLEAELGSAQGLFGRSRRFTDDEERARVAVSKAIHRAIGRVEDADPVVGALLRSRVRTGRRCCYLPAGAESEHGPDDSVERHPDREPR
jgi:hypothetical protein